MQTLRTLEEALAGHRPRRFSRRSWLARAAVAAVVREGSSGVELLLVERAVKAGDRWSGHLAFPGGLEAPGDADAWATATRETSEEAGLDLGRSARRLGELSELVTARHGSLRPMVVTPLAFELVETVELELGPELAAVHWVSLSELCSARARRSRLGRAVGLVSRARGETVGRCVLWGLTLAFADELCRLGK